MRRPHGALAWAELALALLITALIVSLNLRFATQAGPLWRDEVYGPTRHPIDVHRGVEVPVSGLRARLVSDAPATLVVTVERRRAGRRPPRPWLRRGRGDGRRHLGHRPSARRRPAAAGAHRVRRARRDAADGGLGEAVRSREPLHRPGVWRRRTPHGRSASPLAPLRPHGRNP